MELINNYQLLEGYKKTEVGVIPEDWEYTNLANICQIIDGDRGVNYPSDNDFYSDGYCLFLNARNVTKDGFKFNESSFITQEKDSLLRKGKLLRKDIILTTRGTVGNFAFFNSYIPYKNIRINSGMVILRKHESNNLSHLFLYITLRSYVVQNQIERSVFGSAQPQLTVKGISAFKIPLPPLPEQKAIAQTLSDVDALIAALDKHIAKKRNIKTGTMQQLLTGKTRLPGLGEGKGYKKSAIGVIPEDWEVAPLAEITNYIKGFAFKSSDFQSSGVRVIRVSDTTFELIKKESEIFIDPQRLVFFKKWQLKEFDIIISTVGSKPPMYDSMVGKSTFITSKDSGSLLNQNAIVIRANKFSKETQIFLHNSLRVRIQV